MTSKFKTLLSVLIIIVSYCFATACSNDNSQTSQATDSSAIVSITSDINTQIWEYTSTYNEDINTSLKTIHYNGDNTVSYSNSSGKDKTAELYFSIQSSFYKEKIFVGITICEPLSIDSIFDYHSDSYTFTIKMTDAQGNLNILNGKADSNSPNILISETEDVRKIVDSLHQNGKLSFVLVDDVYPTSTYSFFIDTANFSEEYRKSHFSVK